MNLENGHDILNLAKELWPLCRSLTGDGNRKTLSHLQSYIPLKIVEVPSGTQCFDWTIPKEWNIRDAWIKDAEGRLVIDFKQNNLHVLNYSTPIRAKLSLSELQEHLYSLPDLPDAIPYMTSYYKERWGFCLSQKQREKLKDETYEVCIDSELKPGALSYGELIVPGESSQEIFFSTYICHPSLANDDLSGPVVTTALAQYVMKLPKRRYSYRFIFIPETIGAICYLSRNIEILKKNTIAGFNLTCLGDDRAYSFLPSRLENSLADRMARHVLSYLAPQYKSYSFLERGSDERQYCAPGVDLPVASLMRSKYGEYPEYHTSLDNFDLVTASGLEGGFRIHKVCIEGLEQNKRYKSLILGEPQLGKRGLYPSLGSTENAKLVMDMSNVFTYCDGNLDLLSIAEKINLPLWKCSEIAETLLKSGVLSVISDTE